MEDNAETLVFVFRKGEGMKTRRQSRIIELIKSHDVETQEELAELLNEAGFIVTQATISRDIRELKLTKVATEGGKQKYIALQGQSNGLNDKLVRVLRDAYVSMEPAQNILVIKTASGMAMAAAAALDGLELDGMVGCIAGDDTILCAIRSEKETRQVMEQLTELVYGK